MKPDLKFDKRLTDRHVRLGLLEEGELNTFIAQLPDVTERAAPLAVDMGDVGVTDVERKDTGESDD
jgi:hypothetical protein